MPPTEITLAPHDGWGFVENVDGELAAPFSIEVTEEAVEFAPHVVGWRAVAKDGKYQGANLRMTPRHRPWSGVVVLKVTDRKNGQELYYGFADSQGLEPSWGGKSD